MEGIFEEAKSNETLNCVKGIAKSQGWGMYKFDPNSRQIIFRKDEMQINVFYTTMTVGTSLRHPKRGKTQIWRKRVNFDLLQKLFINPRHHTNKGYTTKRVGNITRWL